MQVGDHDVVWQGGCIVIVDDMYPHEVWNHVQDTIRNLERWEQSGVAADRVAEAAS